LKYLICILFILFAFSLAQAQQPKSISVTQQEQEALTQAYIKRQQTQQKVDEKKKLAESILQLLQADLKTAQAEDDNAVMTIRNIELTIGNAHNFNPDKYDKTDKDGKLVYVEKPLDRKDVEKPKEGK